MRADRDRAVAALQRDRVPVLAHLAERQPRRQHRFRRAQRLARRHGRHALVIRHRILLFSRPLRRRPVESARAGPRTAGGP